MQWLTSDKTIICTGNILELNGGMFWAMNGVRAVYEFVVLCLAFAESKLDQFD